MSLYKDDFTYDFRPNEKISKFQHQNNIYTSLKKKKNDINPKIYLQVPRHQFSDGIC